MAKLFGKKQEGAAQDAAVSSIPVPPSDSALVIDLPEGQKLVIGKMEEGTVIEVATWRGTGRPDSRTNRLMLGVSFGGTQTPEPQKQEKELDISNLPGYQKYIYLFRKVAITGVNKIIQVINQLKPLANKLKSKLSLRRGNIRGNKTGIPEIASSAAGENEFDIDKWLDSVRSNSRVSKLGEAGVTGSGAKTRTHRMGSPSKVQKSAPRSKSASAKRPVGKKKSR